MIKHIFYIVIVFCCFLLVPIFPIKANDLNYIERPAFGDQGMISTFSRIFFYSIIDGKTILDCHDLQDASGTGPHLNRITQEINNSLNLSNIGAASPQCLTNDSDSVPWHYWQANIFNNSAHIPKPVPEITHHWTKEVLNGVWQGGIEATYDDGEAKHILNWTRDFNNPNSSTIYSATVKTTSAHPSHGTTYPHANEIPFTLKEKKGVWEGSVWYAREGNSAYQRLTVPQIMACWTQSSGEPCYNNQGQALPDAIGHYVSFDINSEHEDECTETNRSQCPPFHRTQAGVQIPRDDPSFPHHAYYKWCGSELAGYTPTCGLEESYNLQPSTEWSIYGFPLSPIAPNTWYDFKYDVLGLFHQLYFTSYPNDNVRFSIDISAEILGPDSELSYQTGRWKMNILDTPPLPGDLTGDGLVDIFDYQKLITNFGNPYTIFDYQKILANFGK